MSLTLDILKKQIQKGQALQPNSTVARNKTFFEMLSGEALYQGVVYGVCSGLASKQNQQDLAESFSTSFDWPIVLGAFGSAFLVEYGFNKALKLDSLSSTTNQKVLIYGTEAAISAYHGYKKYGTPLQTVLWALYCSPGFAFAEGYAKPERK